MLTSRFDTRGGVLVGDKFTRVKKINDVRENLVKTEAMQHIGNIATRVGHSCSFIESSKNRLFITLNIHNYSRM